MNRVALAAIAAALLAGLPAEGLAADAAELARAVEAIAPQAAPVPGGFRFRFEDVAVSVLADETTGLLRVVARVGELTDREVRLVASALRSDMVPDLAARVVSVRGLMCSAVLAPLRGMTEAVLRRAVEGAAQVARLAARTPHPDAFAEDAAPATSGPGDEEALPGATWDPPSRSGALE